MKTAESYEELPYPSKFFLQTHPDRLATAAALFGMKPAPVDNCRVLELGCGNGSNLVAHAFNLPGSRFVGVDIAENHIAHAAESVSQLGLKNVEFHKLDVMKMTKSDFGEFDYVIAHGLFSWVPDIVREKVLSLCRGLLSKNGVGYISYNAYPGAHSRDMVRSIMMYHTRGLTDPEEKVRRAVSFLALLSEHSADKAAYRSILQHELKRHFEHSAADIYHDDLAESYRPFYFYEFAEMLEKNGLQFLAESELHAMSMHSLPEDVREFIESLDTVVQREQYLDFLRGRIFRQTLFCHKEVALDRALRPSVLDGFLVASSIRPVSGEADLSPGKVEKFVGLKGMGFEIDHPLAKAALVRLGEAWGKAVPFPELLKSAAKMLEEAGIDSGNGEAAANTVRAVFLQLCLGTSLIELHTHQPEAGQNAGERPVLNRLSRWQLRFARNVITRLNLDVKIEDDISRRVLELLDGTRGSDQLQKEMSEFIRSSDDIDGKQDILDNLPAWLDESIAQMAKLGMFED